MIELCACGHGNDHIGKRCGKPVPQPNGTTAICWCESGVRIDVATFQAMMENNNAAERIATTLMRILAVVEVASGLQSSIKNEGGRFHIDVQPRTAAPKIILPR